MSLDLFDEASGVEPQVVWVQTSQGLIETTMPRPAAGVGPEGPPGPAGEPGEPGADGAPGVGVPAAGALGEALRKLSATDYDTAWRPHVIDGWATPPSYAAAGTLPGDLWYNRFTQQLYVAVPHEETPAQLVWFEVWSRGILPQGGTTGQVLVKSSSTQYHAQWQTRSTRVLHHALSYTNAESGDISTPITLSSQAVPVVAGNVYDVRGYVSCVYRGTAPAAANSRIHTGGVVINQYDAWIGSANVAVSADVSVTWMAPTSGTATFVLDIAKSWWSPPIRYFRAGGYPMGMTITDLGPVTP